VDRRVDKQCREKCRNDGNPGEQLRSAQEKERRQAHQRHCAEETERSPTALPESGISLICIHESSIASLPFQDIEARTPLKAATGQDRRAAFLLSE
jgi:hypothetical protein